MQPSALLRGVVLLAGLAGAGLSSACGSDSENSADAGPVDPDGGDPTALDCEGTSGSRIRQVVREHADGSRHVIRLFDNQIGESCAFGLASDSTVRCIPVADGAPVVTGALVYTNPGCTVRLAQLPTPPGEEVPTHMQEVVAGGSADGCSAVTYNYELGNEVAVDDALTLYRKDATDTCVGFTAGANPYYEIASEIGPDLVEGTETWVGQGRIQMRQLDGSDGSRFCDLASFRDLELQTSCQLQYGEDNSIQCLPSALPVGPYFNEGTCAAGNELPLLVVPGECDSGARHAFQPAMAACDYRQRVRTLGEEYFDPYFRMAETCVEVTPAAGDVAYRLGPAIAGTSFSNFSHAYIAAGGDRLERGDLENGGGLRLRAPDAFGQQWRDTTFDTPCTFEMAGDDGLRCLPSGNSQMPIATVATGVFTDTGCATPATVGQIDPTCFGSAEPTHARMGAQVFPVTGPATGLYSVQGTCMPIADLTPYYALGAEIPAAMFVSGEEMTE